MDDPEAPHPAPEKALLAGMLSRAIVDCCHVGKITHIENGREVEKNRRQAHEWLFEEPGSADDIKTFLGVCAALDLDPGKLRDSIRAQLSTGERIKTRAPGTRYAGRKVNE